METKYIPRGSFLIGKVIRAKSNKTAVVEREIVHFVKKYERYKKVRSRIAVHVPDDIKVEVGDMVKIGETRKKSKTKNFVIVSKVKGDSE